MAGELKERRMKIEERDAKFAQSLVERTKKYKQPHTEVDLTTCLVSMENFQNDPNNFVFRGKSKDRTKQFLHLIRYVYEKYPAPRIFDQCWTEHFSKQVQNQGRNTSFDRTNEFLNWYICIATGGSFYKKFAKDFLTKREAHIFLHAPIQLKIREALFYAIAYAANPDIGTASMIACSKLADKDYKSKFWQNCARFFAVNKPSGIMHLNDVLDYIDHRHRENAEFTLFGMGYTFESLVKHMKQWHADLGRIKVLGDAWWDGHPIDNETFASINSEGVKRFWTFTQIKTAKELAAEGNAMRHCVFSYRDHCKTGSVSIWSLSTSSNEYGKSFKRKVTIELLNNGDIVQMRGYANRQVTPEERTIIGKWVNKNGLRINSNRYW